MLVDANLLLYAVHRAAPQHEPAAAWLTEQLNGPRRVGLPWQSLGAFLRIAVSGGGCSGFQYGLSFDEQRNPDDFVFERDDVKVVVDDVSLDLLNGSEVDFVEDMMGASFQIKNPNAASSCGCGNSFSI